MVLPQRLEPDGQGLAVERLGLGVLPLLTQGRREVVVTCGGVGMVLPQRLEPDGQGPAVERLGCGGLPLREQVAREVVVA
jgi:hypothetical protein